MRSPSVDYSDQLLRNGPDSTLDMTVPLRSDGAAETIKNRSLAEFTEFRLEQTSLRVNRDIRLVSSSNGLGWTDLFAAVTDESPHHGVRGATPAVWLVTASTPNEIQRVGPGYTYDRVLPKGAISITGAGEAVYDEIAAPLNALHIYLRQGIVDEVADELFKDSRQRCEVRSSFGLDDAILRQLLASVRSSLNGPRSNNTLKMDYLSQALAAHLLVRHSVLGPTRAVRQMPILNSKEIGRVVDYIDANLSFNMSIAELAGIIGLGRAQFSVRFKASTCMTPHQFVIMKRISRARNLLADARVDYPSIAACCGFASWAHFITTFKAVAGLTPSEYRRRKIGYSGRRSGKGC